MAEKNAPAPVEAPSSKSVSAKEVTVKGVFDGVTDDAPAFASAVAEATARTEPPFVWAKELKLPDWKVAAMRPYLRALHAKTCTACDDATHVDRTPLTQADFQACADLAS